MPFTRPLEYYVNRFHDKQERAWLAYKSGRDVVLDWGRRSGKCLVEGSMIITPCGPKRIEDLKPGDLVYSERGEPIRVKHVKYQGKKRVVDLCNNGTVYETATIDHRWMTIHREHGFKKLRAPKEWYKALAIERLWVKAPLGKVHEPHAYVLGAMLGNGCSTAAGNKWYISSESPHTPHKIAKIIGLKLFKNGGKNYTYSLGTEAGSGKHTKPIHCNHYEEWCKGKLAHEKFCDLEVIKTWDRRSLLEFVAGLIDTDGSVTFNGKEINLRLAMQSKSCIEALQYALLALWQCRATADIDDRPRYKNGPIHRIGVKNILFNRVILKELNPYLVNPKRKYCREWGRLKANNGNVDHVGVTFRNERVEKCWDIEVDSPTHLYLTATGLVTHNSEFIAETFIEDIEDHGRDCMYIALTQGQAREIMWDKFYQRLKDRAREWKSNESRLEWKHTPSGAVISLKGADLGKDKLRGNAKRLIAPDEFAFFRDPTIVKDVLVPQLADFNGQLIYGSTPKGKNHFWRLKKRALADQLKFYTSHCTVFENPFISPEGRDKLISEYDGPLDPLYRQEILAEYIVFEGMAFALAVEDYTCDRWDPADLDHAYHWKGVDHGYSPDPTACLWMAYNRRKKCFLIYNEYKHSELLIKQHADVIKNCEPYPAISNFSDIDPQLIAEYGEVGLTLEPAAKADKQARILRLVNALRTGRLKIAKNCTQLLEEMSSYEWEQDGNDHLIDAMNYVYNNAVIPELPTEPAVGFYTTKSDQGFHRQSFGD